MLISVGVPNSVDDYELLRDPLLAIAMSLASDITSQHRQLVVSSKDNAVKL